MFSKNKGKLIAVFDIASASVGGALLKQKKGGKSKILASVRQQADFSEKENFSRAWRNMRETLKSVSNHLSKKAPQNPDAGLCVFSSPWFTSQTKIIKVQREQPFEVTEELIQKIINDEAQIFKSQKKKSILLEGALLKTSLNGYDFDAPLGKKAQKLEMQIYLSLGLELMKEKITNEILNYIKPHDLFLHSFPFVLFQTLKNLLNTKEGFIFIDITGEITDVFIIRKNMIEEVSSFPSGENFFARRVASVFNCSLREAKSLILQHQRHELAEGYSKKINGVLEPAAAEWSKYLKELLSQSASERFLPQNIYFCGPNSSLKELVDKVGAEDFSKFTIFGKPFNVKFLLPGSLKHHFDFAEKDSGAKNIFLLLGSLFADKFLTFTKNA